MFRQLGIAGIGEDAVGDLKEFRSPEVIKAKMDQVYPEPQSLVNATQCFDFAHRMATGDWIFAKKGRREIIGFGIVHSDYRFDLGRASYQHVRNVDWQKAGQWPTGLTRMLSMKTLTEITEDEALLDELEELMGITDTETPSVVVNTRAPVYTAADFSVKSAIPQETIELWEARLRRKKHIIFQGPPGTGKTYVADRLARLLISDTFGSRKPCNSILHMAMKTSCMVFALSYWTGNSYFSRRPDGSSSFVEHLGKSRTVHRVC